MAEYKLYSVIRTDIEIPVGKLLIQVSHAYLSVWWECLNVNPELAEKYKNEPAYPKISLKGKNEHALRRAQEECKQLNIPTFLVIDAGRTVFKEPTVTVLGIGPVIPDDLPTYVKKLQLF